MAKFIKRTSSLKWKFLSENSNSFLEILNDRTDCLKVEIEEEVNVDNDLLKECTSKFKELEASVFTDKGINLQRAGYFEKSQIQEIISNSDIKYLRIYNAIYEKEHFIFIAAINKEFEVSGEINLLCTKIPPCPPQGTPTPTIPGEDNEDIFYKK
jgi:hypothetical protein